MQTHAGATVVPGAREGGNGPAPVSGPGPGDAGGSRRGSVRACGADGGGDGTPVNLCDAWGRGVRERPAAAYRTRVRPGLNVVGRQGKRT
ncbi:hypothetical protein Slala05_03560 [Streptomyces lavendulae subsp. lavendulae]|nr:hypothetical protein Slala05_03560 [Streptomyces lavendulae subsp. lavendulae]